MYEQLERGELTHGSTEGLLVDFGKKHEQYGLESIVVEPKRERQPLEEEKREEEQLSETEWRWSKGSIGSEVQKGPQEQEFETRKWMEQAVKEGSAKVKSANFERTLNREERELASQIHDQTEAMRSSSTFLTSLEAQRERKRKEREERIARLKARKRQRS